MHWYAKIAIGILIILAGVSAARAAETAARDYPVTGTVQFEYIEGERPISGQGLHQNSPWFQRDKLKHLSSSAWITLAGGYFLSRGADLSGQQSLYGAIGITVGAGIGKEIMDHYTGGHASWRDFATDITGCLVGAVLLHNMP